MDMFSNQKQVALIGMFGFCLNRFNVFFSFPDLNICKIDDDLINVKAVIETNVCKPNPAHVRDDDRSADILCPLWPWK